MVFATFPGPYGPEPLAERMSNRMLIYSSIYLSLSADPCLALAQAGRRPGSPQVCGVGLLGPRPAWSTRHQSLCHCLPKSPQTRCPAAAALCQRLAMSPYRHTPLHPFRGFHNLREARAIRTQNPVVWAFTALVTPNTLPCSGRPLPAPGHVAIIHLYRGFQNVRRARSTVHQDTKPRLWAFTALPLPSQVTANTLPCSSSPLPAPGHVARMPYSTPSI